MTFTPVCIDVYHQVDDGFIILATGPSSAWERGFFAVSLHFICIFAVRIYLVLVMPHLTLLDSCPFLHLKKWIWFLSGSDIAAIYTEPFLSLFFFWLSLSRCSSHIGCVCDWKLLRFQSFTNLSLFLWPILICCLDCVVHVTVKNIIKDGLLQYCEFIVTICIKKEKDSRCSKWSFGLDSFAAFCCFVVVLWLGFYPRDSAKLNNHVWVESLWSYMSLGW